MTKSRLIAIFALFLFAFSVVMGRLFLLAQNTDYAQTAKNQTITTLTLEQQRGNLYDTNGHCLTQAENRYFALSIPGESSYAELFQYVSYEEQATLYKKRNAISPFLVEVNGDLNDLGIYTYTVPQRYYGIPIAEHLIGYLDGDGQGVSGLELAFNELLGKNRGVRTIQCVTTAQGSLMQGEEPTLTDTSSGGSGVMLTLDESIQRACEAIAQETMTKGCILVLETATAKVRASVSMPEFDPNNIQASIQAQDTSLLNRVFCQYNVGSVFKPVLAAAALEKGLDWFSVECEGVLDLNGHQYRCAQQKAHGLTNITSGLEKSCNNMFIQLGLALGAETVHDMAEKFGFGQPIYLAGGLKSAAGNLPSAETLQNLGQLASVSFGQGQLMATPVQLAGAMNVIAGDGQYRTPSFLEGIVDETTKQITESLYDPEVRRVIQADTAKTLRNMLAGVIQEGTGKEAAPMNGAAGGKTGTAQTAVYDEDGKEEMNYWFTGFYPLETPLYTIVVLQDGTPEPQTSSAAIFSKVCDALFWLQDNATQEKILQENSTEIS